jgi:two-component SAPR family response regulator
MIKIQCLGTFFLTVDGAKVDRWRAGKARELFCYLLVRHNRPVARGVLLDAFWPHSEASSTSLKVAAHAVRQVLAEVLPGKSTNASRGSSLELLSHDSGYLLRVENVWIDFEAVEAAVKCGRVLESRGKVEEALLHYLEATDLYSGEFLLGDAAPWIVQEREWLKDLVLEAMERLRDVAIENGDFRSAITWCHRMLDVDPWLEGTYRALMICHTELHQPSRVKGWYELCLRRLREELEMDPEPYTQALFKQAMERGSQSQEIQRGNGHDVRGLHCRPMKVDQGP